MRKLLDFIFAHKHWVILLLLEAFSLILFVGDGAYRKGLRLYAYSHVSGRINEVLSKARDYLNLHEQNEYLLHEKARLESELITLKRSISDRDAESIQLMRDTTSVTEYVVARVVNQISHLGDVYYMINRGRSSGIAPDMAVLSESGVVGIVLEASNRYAIVIPVINTQLRLSSSIKGKGYQGQLTTQGLHRPTILGGLPLHADIMPGDTVVTSGYSYIFPEGLMVGVVEENSLDGIDHAASAFGTYRIRLATDFERLSYVYVRISTPMSEAMDLERSLVEKSL